MSLVLHAYWELLFLEDSLRRKDFAAIYERVRCTPVRDRRTPKLEPAQVSQAVDFAAVLYFRKVLCLQRSAAAVRLLRKRGFPARLVIGVQQIPFAAHAWVELESLVVNDKSYMPDMYTVLERC